MPSYFYVLLFARLMKTYSTKPTIRGQPNVCIYRHCVTTPQQRQSVYKKLALVDYIQVIRGLICLTNHRCLFGACAVMNYFRLCFTTPLRLVQEHKRLHKATFKPDHVDRLFFPAKNRCNVTDLVRDK